LAVAVAPAAAEVGDSAEIRPISDGGFGFPVIAGPAAPEEYPLLLGPVSQGLRWRQVDDQEVVYEYIEGDVISYALVVEPAHDAVGAAVPTTLQLSESADGPVVTLTAHFRAGNPAAGGAPFVFPITGGSGWAGGFHSVSTELNEPTPAPAAVATSPPPAPVPTCTVPALRGLNLRAAKARLRAADCTVGKVLAAAGTRPAKGKVVRQFDAAGTRLAAGAPVAIKLAAPAPAPASG
jgi:PASTA domain